MKYLLASALLIVGCGSGGYREHVDKCEGKDRIVAIDSTFSPERQEAIIYAAYAWQDAMKGLGVIFKPEVRDVVDEFDVCTYTIVNTPATGDDARIAQTTRMGTDVRPSSAILFISEDVSVSNPYDPPNKLRNWQFALVAEHELGHALGLTHMKFEDHTSVMEPNLQFSMHITDEEVATLCVIWGCDHDWRRPDIGMSENNSEE